MVERYGDTIRPPKNYLINKEYSTVIIWNLVEVPY